MNDAGPTTVDLLETPEERRTRRFYAAVVVLALIGGAVWGVFEWHAYQSIDDRLDRIEKRLEVHP